MMRNRVTTGNCDVYRRVFCVLRLCADYLKNYRLAVHPFKRKGYLIWDRGRDGTFPGLCQKTMD